MLFLMEMEKQTVNVHVSVLKQKRLSENKTNQKKRWHNLAPMQNNRKKKTNKLLSIEVILETHRSFEIQLQTKHQDFTDHPSPSDCH